MNIDLHKQIHKRNSILCIANNMSEVDSKYKLCKHCDKSYSKTKEFFYTCNGKLKTDICKCCKKARVKEYNKTYVRKTKQDFTGRKQVRNYEDRKENLLKYQKEYIKRADVKEKRRLYAEQYRARKKEDA